MPPIRGYTGYAKEGYCMSCLKVHNKEKRDAPERKCKGKCGQVKKAEEFHWKYKDYSRQAICILCKREARK